MRISDKPSMKEPMLFVKDFFNKFKIEPYVVGSTLLHAIRDQEISERTLDFEILEEQITPELRESFVALPGVIADGQWILEEPHHTEIHISHPSRDLRYRRYGHEILVWNKRHYVEENWMFVYNEKWRIPAFVEDYLEAYYGDWRFPREFSWRGHARNFISV